MSWTTTLNEIEKHGPCVDDWKTLLSFLNKTEADDAPLGLLTILEACGTEFAIWCLETIDGHAREKVFLAIACVERILFVFEKKCTGDKRLHNGLRAVKKFLKGSVSLEELRMVSNSIDIMKNAARAWSPVYTLDDAFADAVINATHASINAAIALGIAAKWIDHSEHIQAMIWGVDVARRVAHAVRASAIVMVCSANSAIATVSSLYWGKWHPDAPNTADYAAERLAQGELLKKMVAGEL